ncbi:2-amino-4-oxopentanoate thiolase subunit OrtB [Youngiibacter multivorans]|uniref:Cysteine synthase n=1 Tax=Youngiibacter multivorans TaxID=937251 RepID=A0ABS4G2T6_9CLOT|nr:2-amino-4-oxopentanoate thiolase subunit OrtB [Youngiibacter multivorans]MBP1918850.1 cysteine synthase [Youngiibacter multivorans]
MTKDDSYRAVMDRRNEIMKKAIGMDYSSFEISPLSFDYEALMSSTGYSLEDCIRIQHDAGVGNSPLLELKNLTNAARLVAGGRKGARIFIKDEASNPSGSFKDRRAAISVHHAKKLGYKGVVAATSGNYGAAVASQAAMKNLKCIVLQECFDSKGVGQPEILEKQRKCESLGAEVIQLSVGPELFHTFLLILEETGYFNASLYSAFGIAGIETLGYEIAEETLRRFGKHPEAVVITHAGGGNLTGTARGLLKGGAAETKVIGASVDLSGLHMASDTDFNRKSFTTGHTGFGVPFASYPDRSDVPRSAARALRYMDRYLTVRQGEVFYMTEALAQLEGLERGPAGNTSLAAAFALSMEMDRDEIIVVQETEYTGAGKHHLAQLSFARQHGIEISIGDPATEVPGRSIVLPSSPELIRPVEIDMLKLRRSLAGNLLNLRQVKSVDQRDIRFLLDETRLDLKEVIGILDDNGVVHP